jgi:hypothetical protein
LDDSNHELAKMAVKDLQIENALLQLVVVHLTAQFANEAVDPGNWLRMFADEIDASIDRVAPPTNEQARWMVEVLRERLDKLMYGIRTRLAETSRQQGNPET